ncbi:uncharacterized protein LOC105830672 [Monomorium pharaonis]|uniref:uncharacterized protein LOC105830672 n=1 Tax=Monomorium pharaonis TaxID=307658 RepID=UPI0017472464|nr:uncharacterized protein LOC105830672 [Monomorium pharaonis]
MPKQDNVKKDTNKKRKNGSLIQDIPNRDKKPNYTISPKNLIPADQVPVEVKQGVTISSANNADWNGMGNTTKSARNTFIKSQLSNQYSNGSLGPFIVHIESTQEGEDQNIENLHPMSIGQMLYKKSKEANYKHIYNNVLNIIRKGRNLMSIEFKTSEEANNFIDKKELIPKNWTVYIPNFKIYRIGVIRNVSQDITDDEFVEGLEWPNNQQNRIKINKVERLMYMDKQHNNVLKPSTTVKIIFESSLLPEFLYLYKVRHRVLPYINKVRKCNNCCRWGHTFAVCRGKLTCGNCGENHTTVSCNSMFQKCANCGGDHNTNELQCPSFQYHKLVNYVMAYTNNSQFNAKQLIKRKEIVDIAQVSSLLKSLAYMGWNTQTDLEAFPIMDNKTNSSIYSSRIYNRNRYTRSNMDGDRKIHKEMEQRKSGHENDIQNNLSQEIYIINSSDDLIGDAGSSLPMKNILNYNRRRRSVSSCSPSASSSENNCIRSEHAFNTLATSQSKNYILLRSNTLKKKIYTLKKKLNTVVIMSDISKILNSQSSNENKWEGLMYYLTAVLEIEERS